MRRTSVGVEKQVETAELGSWRSPTIGFATPYGLFPFVKSREDIEVILRRPSLLPSSQPVELSGFSLHRSLRHALVLQSVAQTGPPPATFKELASNHHVQVSWPSDLLWLAHPESVSKFQGFVADSLRLSEMAILPSDCEKISNKLSALAAESPRGFMFWRKATREQYSSVGTLSRLLIESAIAAANQARAHSMAGIVPCLDLKTPGSLQLLDSYNAGFAHVIQDRVDEGLRAPAYLYTVPVNSTAIRADEWPRQLDNLLTTAENAIATDVFEGMHLSIRGLERISISLGRVSVAKKLMNGLRAICASHQVPLFWSRASFPGLAARDMGVQFASYRLNLSVGDVYSQGGGVSDPVYAFGRVVNPIQKVTWTRSQVELAMRGPDGGLPDLGNAATSPTVTQLARNQEYRIGFSKPYNVASFRYLDNLWTAHVKDNETHPGREYLQTFEAPYNQWGLR